MDDIKRRVRKLKKIETKIRWGAEGKPGVSLVWDSFFDLRAMPAGKAKHTLAALSSMSREEFKSIVDEFFAYVYYEYYKENGITGAGASTGMLDPSILALLDLPFDSNERDVKKRFRELAKKYHPDKGGDAVKFIELMKAYEGLGR